MTTNKQWTVIREQVFADQNGKCWVCPKVHGSHDTMHAHHSVYSRDKKFDKWLNSVENIFLICPECHAHHGGLSNLFKRHCAWTDKIDMGYDMQAWHDKIPMLVKDEFEYIGHKED